MAIKTKILAITLIMVLFTCIAAPAVMGADVADDNISVGGKKETITIITLGDGENNSTVVMDVTKDGKIVIMTEKQAYVDTYQPRQD